MVATKLVHKHMKAYVGSERSNKVIVGDIHGTVGTIEHLFGITACATLYDYAVYELEP